MLLIDSHVCTTATRGLPDFTMDTRLKYLGGDMHETLGVLSRRLLAHWLPQGHTFDMQPRHRALNCSSGYVKWCFMGLNFLARAASFTSGVAAPRGAGKSNMSVGM